MNTTSNENRVKMLANKYGYLPYMIKRYILMFGQEETELLLETNEKKTKPAIRINTLKICIKDLLTRLKRKGIELKQFEEIPYGFEVVKLRYNLGSTHEYLQGHYYLQNKASMLAALILDPKPNEIIIDMCSAPGSKATQVAQDMKNEGSLILLERNIRRIPKLEYNLRRLGVKNSVVINMDARDLKKLNLKADRILLDAPCTGEGLIRNDPRRKRNRSMTDIKKMAKIQTQLLKSGLLSLRKGGKLVYSTCSLAPEENEFVVDNVLEKLQGFSILKINSVFGTKGFNRVFDRNLLDDLSYSRRLLPHLDDTIGFYICLIQKHF